MHICVPMYLSQVYRKPLRPEEDIRSSGIEVTGSHKPPWCYWKLNPGPIQVQQVLLTIELSCPVPPPSRILRRTLNTKGMEGGAIEYLLFSWEIRALWTKYSSLSAKMGGKWVSSVQMLPKYSMDIIKPSSLLDSGVLFMLLYKIFWPLKNENHQDHLFWIKRWLVLACVSS